MTCSVYYFAYGQSLPNCCSFTQTLVADCCSFTLPFFLNVGNSVCKNKTRMRKSARKPLKVAEIVRYTPAHSETV